MAVSNTHKFPEIRVFAGPNGSGKSSITLPESILPPYINADVIKVERHCEDIEAAVIATELREQAVTDRRSFTFETVLSTDRNMLLLERAKEAGYFIRCSFILTTDPLLNVQRVRLRFLGGGHAVPPEKVVSRYYKSLSFIPRLSRVCDRLNIYDNTLAAPRRIFKQRGNVRTVFPVELWNEDDIIRLVSQGKPPESAK